MVNVVILGALGRCFEMIAPREALLQLLDKRVWKELVGAGPDPRLLLR